MVTRRVVQRGKCRAYHASIAPGLILWQAWGRRWPATLAASDEQREILARAAAISPALAARLPFSPLTWLTHLGRLMLSAGKNARDMTALIGQLALDIVYL